MSVRRNWFVRLSLFLAIATVLFMINTVVWEIQARAVYSYLTRAVLILGMFLSLIVVLLLSALFSRMSRRLGEPGRTWKTILKIAEAALVATVLAAGLLVRIWYIRTYPLSLESDYKLYYSIAEMIRNGTLLTQSNNEYISLFPHTFGYSFILSLVLRIFGPNPTYCLYFNAVISMLTALIVYGIGKKLNGSLCGIIALLLTVCWPSQIIYSNINGAEAVFTFILFAAAYLAISTMKKYTPDSKKTAAPLLLHIAIGLLIAAASAVRPMSVVFLVAVVLSLILTGQKLSAGRIKNRPFSYIFLSKGWLRAAAVLAGYLAASALITTGVEASIGKDTAGAGATGYSLMVGTDLKSDGGYSEDSMKYLMHAYERTKDPNKAHALCADVAIVSIRMHPVETLELFAKKAYLVWANDDYATTANIVTMNNQGLLTPEREKLLKEIALYNNVYYLFVVFFAGIGILTLFRRDSNAFVFVLFFIGAFALHLLVEEQNRYHYYLLQNFCILAAVGITLAGKREVPGQKEEKTVAATYAGQANAIGVAQPLADTQQVPDMEQTPVTEDTAAKEYAAVAEYTASMQQTAVMERAAITDAADTDHSAQTDTAAQVVFEGEAVNHLAKVDILLAIKEGHITVTASEAFRTPPKTGGDPPAADKNEGEP